ncbi:MAG: helix-turn-helix domain-containing protein [Porticoccaceae bacterium]|nr:helix-turn-helix domain-containing protein [Porticoccaceae bacterium]
MNTAKALKKTLHIRRMTARQLAIASGVDKATLSLIINEKTNPRLKTIVAICNAVDMKVSHFCQLGGN